MLRRKVPRLMVGVLVGLAIIIAVWAMPQSAQAGGVHLSIGVGIPAPVYVGPPPVVVQPAPVIIQPAPSVVYPGVVFPPPVVYTVPYGVYGRPLPPGLAKKYYGHHHGPGYYKIYKHGKHGW
jgi:PXPV repeat-containing protein